MKRILYLVLLVIINLLVLISCTHPCNNKLGIENKKIPYKNGEIVHFKNDTLGVVNDTIAIYLDDLETKAYSSIGDNSKSCNAWSIVTYSNSFYIRILQDFNDILYFTGQGRVEISPQNPVIIHDYDDFPLNDFIDFTYNANTIKAYHMYYPIDTLGSPIWEESHQTNTNFVYNDYIYITDPEIKLLQYTTVYRDGKRRVWRLVED